MSENGFSESFSVATQDNPGEPEFTDQTINCIDCRSDFIWTSGEQQFFYDKNLKNPPKRCKPCKQAKNERIAAINAAQELGIKQRIEVTVACQVRLQHHRAVLSFAGPARLLPLVFFGIESLAAAAAPISN